MSSGPRPATWVASALAGLAGAATAYLLVAATWVPLGVLGLWLSGMLLTAVGLRLRQRVRRPWVRAFGSSVAVFAPLVAAFFTLAELAMSDFP